MASCFTFFFPWIFLRRKNSSLSCSSSSEIINLIVLSIFGIMTYSIALTRRLVSLITSSKITKAVYCQIYTIPEEKPIPQVFQLLSGMYLYIFAPAGHLFQDQLIQTLEIRDVDLTTLTINGHLKSRKLNTTYIFRLGFNSALSRLYAFTNLKSNVPRDIFHLGIRKGSHLQYFSHFPFCLL